MSAEGRLYDALTGSQLTREREALRAHRAALAGFQQRAADESRSESERRRARMGVDYAEAKVAKVSAEVARLEELRSQGAGRIV